MASSSAAAVAAANVRRRVIRGVVFDMDGTLIHPSIDFAKMKRTIGLSEKDKDILGIVNSWDAPRREWAFQEIHRIEIEALERMRAFDDTDEVCRQLDALGIPRALVTRNMQASVAHFHATTFGLSPFQPALCRETFHAHKPSPEPLLHIADVWGIHPSELAMVGDSPKDDVVSGQRAGALTILLSHECTPAVDPTVEEQRPHFTVGSLTEVLQVLQKHCSLEPPPAKKTTVVQAA